MNITKEYIKECDCKEIQILRVLLDYGDWFQERTYPKFRGVVDTVVPFRKHYPDRYSIIWLPTGDQLDDGIVKICKGKKLGYNCYFDYGTISCQTDKFGCEVKTYSDGARIVHMEGEINPLIAKIKLLKALLKDNN